MNLILNPYWALFLLWGDKDVDGLLALLEPVIDRLVLTQNYSERAMPSHILFEKARAIFGSDRVFLESDLQSAITYAMEQCTLLNQLGDGSSAVVVTGSVVTVGQTRTIVHKIARSVGTLDVGSEDGFN